MSRELNRELFGKRSLSEPETQTMHGPLLAKADDVRVLQAQFEAAARRMKEYESKIEVLHTKVESMTATNKQRFERVQSHFQRQTEMLQGAMGDVHGKIAQVLSRVNERKLSEGVIKEMVDRHGQVVQAFEVRLQQFQKVISDQELQLMHARLELKEALHELARLKKF